MGAFDDLVPGKSAGAFDDLVPKKGKERAYDPTEDMSFGDKVSAGAGKAMVDTYRGLRQLAAKVGIGDEAAIQAEVDEAKKLDAPLMETGGGIVGNVAGNVATFALPGMGVAKGVSAVPKAQAALQALLAARPVAAGMAGGVGTGAIQGAVQPVASDESRGKNIAINALAGGAGGALPGLLAKPIGGKVLSGDVQKLVDEGVNVTPGQAMGGVFKSIEDKATSIPLIGEVIKRAQVRGLEDFNRAGFNRALAPIGERVGKDFNIGREGIAAVESKIGQAYDRALDKIKIVQLDDQFNAEVGKILDMTQELGEGPAKQFATILQNRLQSKVTPAGTFSAETMKETESILGQLAAKWKSSQDPAQQGLGDAIREVQSSLRGAVERTAGPEAAKELRNANTAWANFVRLRDAASRVGAEEGVFTPAQLTSAVRKNDRSAGKGAFARGDALMQDLTDSAKAVLPNKTPNSGTVDRLLNAGALGGAPFLLDPSTLLSAGAAALPYSKMGGQVTLAMLAKRPDFMRKLAEILEQGAPAGGLAAGMAAPSLTGP